MFTLIMEQRIIYVKYYDYNGYCKIKDKWKKGKVNVKSLTLTINNYLLIKIKQFL